MCRMQSTRFEKMVYTDVPSKGGSEVMLRRIVFWILSRLEFCGTDKSVRSATLIGFKLKLIGASCLKSMKFLGHFHDVFWYMGRLSLPVDRKGSWLLFGCNLWCLHFHPSTKQVTCHATISFATNATPTKFWNQTPRTSCGKKIIDKSESCADAWVFNTSTRQVNYLCGYVALFSCLALRLQFDSAWIEQPVYHDWTKRSAVLAWPMILNNVCATN